MELRPGDPASGALHLRLSRRGEPVAMSDILQKIIAVKRAFGDLLIGAEGTGLAQ
jgi:hypothetical protein